MIWIIKYFSFSFLFYLLIILNSTLYMAIAAKKQRRHHEFLTIVNLVIYHFGTKNINDISSKVCAGIYYSLMLVAWMKRMRGHFRTCPVNGMLFVIKTINNNVIQYMCVNQTIENMLLLLLLLLSLLLVIVFLVIMMMIVMITRKNYHCTSSLLPYIHSTTTNF